MFMAMTETGNSERSDLGRGGEGERKKKSIHSNWKCGVGILGSVFHETISKGQQRGEMDLNRRGTSTLRGASATDQRGQQGE